VESTKIGCRATPSFGFVYCLVALMAALTAALVFVMFRRKPPSSDATTQTREIVTIPSTEQPPMAVTIDVNEKVIWIESPYSAANVKFLKSHYARWCSDRNCWYMLAASSAAAARNLDAVLERFDSCSEPSRTGAGKQVQEIDVHGALLRLPGPVIERRRQHQASQAAVSDRATVSAGVVHVHGALRCSSRIDVRPPHAHGPVATAGNLWYHTVRDGW
jgi:hypothetical protein